jgi:hypothetical protein
VGASDGDMKGSATLPSSFSLYRRPVAPQPRGLLAFIKGYPPALFVLSSLFIMVLVVLVVLMRQLPHHHLEESFIFLSRYLLQLV